MRSQAAAAVDDCSNVRRLNGAIFMVLPSRLLFFNEIYDQTEVPRKALGS